MNRMAKCVRVVGLFLTLPVMGSLPALAFEPVTLSVRPGPREGGFSTRYVEVRGRPGARQGFLLIVVDNPAAQVMLFAGGKGNLGISPGGIRRGGNFLVRSRGWFAARGFNVAVLDVPSDRRSLHNFRTSGEHRRDLAAVAAYLVETSPAPLWAIGTSRGTISAAHYAGYDDPRLKARGVVLTSSVLRPVRQRATVFDAGLGEIRQPVLLVHHRRDGCRITLFEDLPGLLDALRAARTKHLMAIAGGDAGAGGNPCRGQSHHGLLGQEAQVVRRIAEWIRAHPPR